MSKLNQCIYHSTSRSSCRADFLSGAGVSMELGKLDGNLQVDAAVRQLFLLCQEDLIELIVFLISNRFVMDLK